MQEMRMLQAQTYLKPRIDLPRSCVCKTSKSSQCELCLCSALYLIQQSNTLLGVNHLTLSSLQGLSRVTQGTLRLLNIRHTSLSFGSSFTENRLEIILLSSDRFN